jgi:hypothetical protein
VEPFEVIRRGYAAGETIQGQSKKHGVHRRMVRQAIGNCYSSRAKSGGTRSAETGSGHGAHRADAGL